MSKICNHPFHTIQIQNTGEVYCCCCYWTDFYSFGNIFEQSFDEIWNGEKAKAFRKQFIENNFKYCKLDVCDPFQKEININEDLTAEYPKQIEFSYDRRCNVRCIFCRTKPNKEEEEYNRAKEKRIEENFDRIFTPILEKAEIVEMNSAGELFASKHSIDVVRKIIKINPKIKFNIISNGTLFTKERIEELDLKSRLSTVIISIHSATEKTYNKLVEHGNFKELIKNVEYLSELKKQGLLNGLQLNFVVTSINYKEMKKFAQLAKKLDAKAFFINYHRQIDSDSLMNELDVSLPTHPKYNDIVKLLSDPIFKDDCCVVNDYLKNLKPIKKSFIEKIKDLLKK
ncbi:MAG: SPASM domain-containing protein [Candidatus Gastranaerophilales bacterium]|nr:SPASM domain-containing protein [Candidatus Gastranaerophilales bacterium]